MIKRSILLTALTVLGLWTGPALLSAKTLKIISLAPNITELLYAIGKGGSIVADTRQCNFPESAKKLPKIGDMANVNIERIVALKPDIVIASRSGNSREQAERIASFGIRVVTLKENTVADIISNTAELGRLLKANVSFPLKVFRMKLESVKPSPVRKKALLLVSAFPFYAVSTNTFMGDMLRIAGFENVVMTAVGYPMLTREELAVLQADTVILPERYKKDDPSLEKMFGELEIYPERIYLNEDSMSRPGPRVFDTIIELSRLGNK